MAYGLIDLKNLVERLVEETNDRIKERTNCVEFIPSNQDKKEGTLYFSITSPELSDAVRKHIKTYLFREEFLNGAKIIPVSEVRVAVQGYEKAIKFKGVPARLDDVYIDFYVRK